MSSLLEYFSPRVQYIFEFTSKIRINEREISSLLEYFFKASASIFNFIKGNDNLPMSPYL